MRTRPLVHAAFALLLAASAPALLSAQGVTTAAMSGFVTSRDGTPVVSARIVVTHEPSGTPYSAESRSGGAYNIRNMRVGGPYRVVATMIGFRPDTTADVFLNLGQDLRLDLVLEPQAVQLQALEVTGEQSDVMNAGRTGAATWVSREQIAALPSIKRSTRDLTRLDPRSDGNFSFGGRNWLYNNISLDGSYFGNPFGLDDPAPGGQSSAEPVPYDAVEQVQVSIAPFDVRQGGFTGANINTVTRSGTNLLRVSAYTFGRNEQLIGNTVSGSPVVANPDLSFLQTGLSAGGPLIRDRLFLFVNGEIERTDDPGTTFAASRGGASGFGISRVDAAIMDSIRQRMISAYNYDPGPYEGYINETNNNKFLAKLDWNLSPSQHLTLRYNYLDATRDLPPHPFVLSVNNTGRGPNASSLPFRNSGYRMNNQLHSVAFELNSSARSFANRLFISYNQFRDFRTAFTPEPWPTIEIGEAGVTYTTVGQEPFSIHNILDQDVLQFTNNLSIFRGSHVFTVGATAEFFSFFNSFNIFRNGVFFLPAFIPIGTTYSDLDDFFADTDPANPAQRDFRALVGSGPFKGENISVGQIAGYLQDEILVSPRLTLTLGVRVDFPIYRTTPVDNPFSRGLTARDENGQAEVVDQSVLPGATPMLSPRVGFNWDPTGNRTTQVRGGTGIFTGRVPFVWVGNVISNPGGNPNLYPTGPEIPTSSDATLAQSFDVNAMVPNFRWPQVWTTDLAFDQQLPRDILGTLEVVYGRDLNAVVMRNADLVAPVGTLADGRPFYGGFGANELNPDGGAGIYVIDNTNEGWSLNVTAQLRREFSATFSAMVAYNYLDARNNLKSTEIASVLWQNQPVQGDPNRPELSFSEFGQRHRLIGASTWSHRWSPKMRTQVGMFVEVGQGNQFTASGGNRYSFIYAGDVNGDGQGGNDLIYIPAAQSEITFDPFVDGAGNTVSPAEQWTRLDALIAQDPYLSSHRGQIAERFGAITPWYTSVDMRILHDFTLGSGHGFQLSLDMLNVGNFLSSSWGVRKVANPAATSPLSVVRFDAGGEPVFNYTGPTATFVDDPSLQSRWRAQVGLRYFLN